MSVYGDHVLPRLINVGCDMKASREQRARLCAGLSGEVVEIGSSRLESAFGRLLRINIDERVLLVKGEGSDPKRFRQLWSRLPELDFGIEASVSHLHEIGGGNAGLAILAFDNLFGE